MPLGCAHADLGKGGVSSLESAPRMRRHEKLPTFFFRLSFLFSCAFFTEEAVDKGTTRFIGYSQHIHLVHFGEEEAAKKNGRKATEKLLSNGIYHT